MNRHALIRQIRARCDSASQRHLLDRIAALPIVDEILVREDGRQDSQTLLMFTRQLEQVLSTVEREEFAELPMANGDVLPIDSSINEGAKSFVYYVYSGAGVARFLSAYAGESLPMVTIQAAEVTGKVEPMGNAYGYTTADVRHAAFAGVPLDSELGIVARRAHDELLNKTGFWGREDLGLPGLLNHPNIQVSDAPQNAGMTSTTWPNKTFDEIAADVNTLIHTVDESTFGMERVNRVYISRPRYNLIKTLRSGTGDGSLRLLQYLEEVHPEVTFLPLDELGPDHSDGNLTEHAMFGYTAGNTRKASLIQPMPFRQYPVQSRDLTFVVPCESSTGGVKMPRPLMCHRMDGI